MSGPGWGFMRTYKFENPNLQLVPLQTYDHVQHWSHEITERQLTPDMYPSRAFFLPSGSTARSAVEPPMGEATTRAALARRAVAVEMNFMAALLKVLELLGVVRL